MSSIDVTDKDKSTHLRLPRGIREFVNVEEKTHGLLSLTQSLSVVAVKVTEGWDEGCRGGCM
jgi:hypothetical protein